MGTNIEQRNRLRQTLTALIEMRGTCANIHVSREQHFLEGLVLAAFNTKDVGAKHRLVTGILFSDKLANDEKYMLKTINSILNKPNRNALHVPGDPDGWFKRYKENKVRTWGRRLAKEIALAEEGKMDEELNQCTCIEACHLILNLAVSALWDSYQQLKPVEEQNLTKGDNSEYVTIVAVLFSEGSLVSKKALRDYISKNIKVHKEAVLMYKAIKLVAYNYKEC